MVDEKKIYEKIARELDLGVDRITKTVQLIDEGNTVPFIARYRKEITGGMTDENLRDLHEKLILYRNFEKRKADILRMLAEKEILTPELEKFINSAKSITELEDIYRPYRPKKRTRATIALEKGLKPLADMLLSGSKEIEVKAGDYLKDDVPTIEEALKGAKDIVAEKISDDHKARYLLRNLIYSKGSIAAQSRKDESEKKDSSGEKDTSGKYEMYARFQEPLSKIQPHRILALNRGEKEDFLQIKIMVPEDEAVMIIRSRYIKEGFSSFSVKHLEETVKDSWKRLLFPSLEREVRGYLTEKGEEQALKVFKENLKNLLMAPPVQGKRLLGIDPGLRTGCKVACVTETGSLLETAVIFPTPPRKEKEKSARTLRELITRHNINAIAIGNGTGCRETEEFVSEMLSSDSLDIHYTIVNEAGASIYSASRLGQEEFPYLDVAERSAVSIARRLQDPLSELVKIDPGSIGVGQYQHDVNQKKLKETLNGVVESCVNLVGVDLNTASTSLLSYIAGINKTVATNMVKYREEQGLFTSRSQLKSVPRLGTSVFKQCAGFLRITDAKNYLDRSAVHPESYKTAKKMMEELGLSFEDLGNPSLVPDINIKELSAKLEVGIPTLEDILREFKRPGRDPREDLPSPVFKKGVLDIKDLKEGMQLKGVVRNVVDFGAFIDIGVHQDGLAHISELSDSYVKHPLEVIKVGDVVEVKVISINQGKKRISLTLKH